MSNLAAWRTQRTQQITLPSGLIVTVRKVALLDMAERGEIPLPLHGQVEALLGAAGGRGKLPFAVADFAAQGLVINLIVAAALIDPPVAEVADDTHLAIGELPFLDRIEIFNWAQEEAAALAPFSGEPAGSGAPVRRGKPRLSPAAERAAAGELDRLPDQHDGAAAGPDAAPHASGAEHAAA